MEENTELVLRRICCTCLSVDRKLSQLCKMEDGVNNLFFLLSSDSEAYEALFSRDATLLFVCWECTAFMRKQRNFIDQVCIAQKQLSLLVDGQKALKSQSSLSRLITIHRNSYNKEFIYNELDKDKEDTVDNFIDCGPNININGEADSILDLQNDSFSDGSEELNTVIKEEIVVLENKLEIKPLSTKTVKRNIKSVDKLIKIEEFSKIHKTEERIVDSSEKKAKRKVKSLDGVVKEEGFSKTHMTEEEMIDSIEKKKLEEHYVDAKSKCESCVEVFKDDNELEDHNSRLHVQKPKFVQCDICLVYIKFWWLAEHRNGHYLKYQCHFCAQIYFNLLDMLLHLKFVHSMRDALTPGIMKKLRRKAMLTNPILAPKPSDVKEEDQMDQESHSGFKCSDCNKYFENRYLRYKHILKMHREGHKCKTCGKTFAFKNTLNKHEQVHAEPQPQEQCPVCGKMVRAGRAAAHARIHGARQAFACAACDKRFVSRDSYEKHLKYSRRHATRDVHKYKCTMCEKGFRTLRELSDHVNYNHMGKTQHQCPICHKALATRRCVTRHVSRAHHGIKEKSGDKILCQTCGKAFRDKKSLREHELIHTGEKPLSCDMCGRAFRQSACLYTHRRRVHKVQPKRHAIQHAPVDRCAHNKTDEFLRPAGLALQ